MNHRVSIARRVVACTIAVGLALATFPIAAFADSGRIVTLGANLSHEEREKVLSFFGLTEDDLQNLTVVTVTNEDEREHLSDSIDLNIIGDKTYSCSYIEPTDSGGIYVKTANLTYVTNRMLYNALQTSGVKSCNLVVTAPFPVSGTGALTGVFMAYEAQGKQLDEAKEEVATEELVTTAELDETYGEQIPDVISDVKNQVISSTEDLSDDQIRDIIRTAAASRGIALSDADVDKIMELLNRLRELDYDAEAFSDTLSDFEAKLRELTDQAQGAGGIFDAIGGFFKSIGDFFTGLFNGGKVPSADEVKQGAEDFFGSFNTDVFQWD